ncbi:hypothetical protein J3B02_003786 [Coemansia erecta]|uniref:Cytochrome c oxidase assembly protein COX20, mitochondrial n=1 Tax=Coemansia asiatica TaxID=1052880 RepID=A0A9W7XQ06_9FUNG|nr:hypothetical protein LPJ64_000905 [Coemansia asiatica]KAJ2849505.1 hypothetical protein J3B02_003786 [Coemansia erecta]
MAGDDKSDLRGDEQKPHRTISDVAKVAFMAHRWDDLANVLHEEPCAREGLLYGIGTGVGVGVLRFIRTGRGINAGNWAVGTFAVVAIVAKKLCHYQQMHQRAKTRTLLEMQSKVSARVKGFEPGSTDGGSTDNGLAGNGSQIQDEPKKSK